MDGIKIKEAFIAGVSLLAKNKDYINELNVFPVPDGDTGTNMYMTLHSAVQALSSLEDNSIETVCTAISSGSLRGARGNSGVIMSQILRGFTNGIKTLKKLDEDSLFDAMTKAKDTAYKAVVKPKEGTILTVIKGISEKALEVKNKNLSIIEKFETVVEYGDSVLEKTPEMLPILKEAGVVDSGGKGLMTFMHGILSYMKGEEIELIEAENKPVVNLNVDIENDQDIKFGYCTEFIINNSKGFPNDTEEKLIKFFDSIGDSLVVVVDTDLVKIHVHTNHPGQAFEKGLEYGFLTNMKVDNLKLEHHEKVIKDAEKKAKEMENKKNIKLDNVGFISVSSGDGLSKILKDLGVNHIIEGGQTMNPSTEDFLNAIEQVNAKNIFIFPNNSNVIMAAKQAKDIVKNKKVYVVETKNILQGINCMIYYNEKENIDEVYNDFLTTIKNVKTLETTYAVRNTTIDGIDIKENDYITIGDSGLLATNNDLYESVINSYEKIKNENDSVISIYYGKDVNSEKADKLAEKFKNINKNIDVEVYPGGQPIYYFYISIE